ncbi:hypothetical protein C8Q80DRAFT_306059 [Daedaleopsis nitida]|nr:hypothetical protein C8Q80DRAFT_306059 [Daedaleopsis nitida]
MYVIRTAPKATKFQNGLSFDDCDLSSSLPNSRLSRAGRTPRANPPDAPACPNHYTWSSEVRRPATRYAFSRIFSSGRRYAASTLPSTPAQDMNGRSEPPSRPFIHELDVRHSFTRQQSPSCIQSPRSTPWRCRIARRTTYPDSGESRNTLTVAPPYPATSPVLLMWCNAACPGGGSSVAHSKPLRYFSPHLHPQRCPSPSPLSVTTRRLASYLHGCRPCSRRYHRACTRVLDILFYDTGRLSHARHSGGLYRLPWSRTASSTLMNSG